MAIYLTHLRNQKGDPATGRRPDENFAREAMQLFSIGLYELNTDGSLKLDGTGQPVETYGNDDVQALAKVMTGWSWGFDDAQLTPRNFTEGDPNYSATGSARADLRPMKNYAGFHATEAVTMFAGKPWSFTVAAGSNASVRLKAALDGLFKHPNVAPFISRQMIQRLVTSNPSPAYIGRVAAVFNNNGQGVRGDLAAVVRSILLDSEARSATPAAAFGKLREPVLRVTQWMRGIGVTSGSGEFKMLTELEDMQQAVFLQPSVFNYFRPDYVAPSTSLAAAGLVAPEFQISSESGFANWMNRAARMSDGGIGWNGSGPDVYPSLDDEIALLSSGGAQRLVERLNLVLFAGRMPDTLRLHLFNALAEAGSDPDRVRIALRLCLSSVDFLVDR